MRVSLSENNESVKSNSAPDVAPQEAVVNQNKVQDEKLDANSTKGKSTPRASNLKRYAKVLVISLAFILAIGSLTYVALVGKEKGKFPGIEVLESIIGATSYGRGLDTPSVPEIRDKENPVNGTFVTKSELDAMQNRKLVVVSVNNHSSARPQAGLSKADLVLEVLAEGGITRYNAFFYQNQSVEEIGPVRSARSYMLEFMLGFDDPVFVHEGQASYPPQETAVPETNTLYHLSAWGINSMQTAASRYRDPERISSSGYVHSLMTGFDLINPEIERLGWTESSNITPLKFKEDGQVEERPASGVLDIKLSGISSSKYQSKFEYDPQTNTYLRSIGGVADIDALDDTRIAPKTVVVEFHDYRDAMDGHSRIILDMIGEDEAYIFQDGEMTKGTWKKTARTNRTKYYDETGKEIEFNRGQMWVVNAAKTATKRISTISYDGQVL